MLQLQGVKPKMKKLQCITEEISLHGISDCLLPVP